MKIYVVIGKTGEYSDRSEWPVCWRDSLEDAQAVVAKLDAEAAEFKRFEDSEEGMSNYAEQDKRKAAMTDPSFSCDYTGTTYHVWAVDKEARS